LEIPRLKPGDTIYEIIGYDNLEIIEYHIDSVIFTGISYILPYKAIGKYEFFDYDFGTILFFNFTEAYNRLLLLKEIQKHGNKN